MSCWLSLLFCLVTVLTAHAEKTPARTCRILFLNGPDSAPDTLHLFDGTRSQEVDLPRMNLSKVYELPTGPLTLRLLDKPVTGPKLLPTDAPSATVAETMLDLYLLVTSVSTDPSSPLRIQIISANNDQLRSGQMLWFNLSDQDIGGVVGSQKLLLRAQSRQVMEAPASKNEGYAVNLSYRRDGSDSLYPLCETKWQHDPRSRSLAFVIKENGARTPRVMVFPDYREAPEEKP
ncbi:MAG: hypothetical protein RI957_1953 [Verrucomicrobiota bacterium]|jgi:hypothetical protein